MIKAILLWWIVLLTSSCMGLLLPQSKELTTVPWSNWESQIGYIFFFSHTDCWWPCIPYGQHPRGHALISVSKLGKPRSLQLFADILMSIQLIERQWALRSCLKALRGKEGCPRGIMSQMLNKVQLGLSSSLWFSKTVAILKQSSNL